VRAWESWGAAPAAACRGAARAPCRVLAFPGLGRRACRGVAVPPTLPGPTRTRPSCRAPQLAVA
jgi:hypothetical protein